MIGVLVRSAAATNPPRPNRCSLYRSLNGLPIALEPLRPHADELPGGEQPLGVGVAGQRVPALAGELADERQLEHEVGPEHAQVAVCRGDGRRWPTASSSSPPRPCPSGWRRAAHHAVSGMFSRPRVSIAEPLVVQRAEGRQEDPVGQFGVEAEVVDLVVAGDPAAQEGQRARPPGCPSRCAPRCRPQRRGLGIQLASAGARARATGPGACPRRRLPGCTASSSWRRPWPPDGDDSCVRHRLGPSRSARQQLVLDVLDPLLAAATVSGVGVLARPRDRRTSPRWCAAGRKPNSVRIRVVSIPRP